jgi:hypothetical protein
MADYIFKSNGSYLGFVEGGNLFSRDGAFLGWIENNIHTWDSSGRYRGQRWNNKYVIVNTFALTPVPRPPRQVPTPPPLPDPPANIPAIALPTGWKDAF